MDVQIEATLRQPTELFKKPVMVEVLGAGFDKPSGCAFFTLRFPRVVKIHQDRSYPDALGFTEYQQLADESRRITEGDHGQIVELWLEKLDIERLDTDCRHSDRSTEASMEKL